MRFTIAIAIAMLAMMANSVCAQSGSSSAPAAVMGAADVYSGSVGGSGTVGGMISDPSSVMSGEVIQSAPMYDQSSSMMSGGQMMGSPVGASMASSDCGCGGGAVAAAPAPVSYAPAASPCGCGSPCPPVPPVDPCCPQQRRGFFRNLFGN